jgi:hypothetical protein
MLWALHISLYLFPFFLHLDIYYPAPLVQLGMTPCLFLDTFPGKNLIGVGNEQLKQFKFPLG